MVIDKINRFPLGFVFTYSDLDIEVGKIDAVTKALSRLVIEGKIKKLSPGRFYKPRLTEFGELKPETYQVVKDILEKDGKMTGYLTGFSVFNELGLTTQVSNIIQIGANDIKKPIRRGIFKIKFIKQNNRISKENIQLLRLLDAVRYIKNIPDTTNDNSCRTLIKLLKQLGKDDLESLIKLSLKYPPSTRALTGAIIERAYNALAADLIFRSLNASSSYRYNISEKVLLNKDKWNIE